MTDLNQDSIYQNQSEIDEHLNKKFSEKNEQSDYFSSYLDENKPRHDYTVLTNFGSIDRFFYNFF